MNDTRYDVTIFFSEAGGCIHERELWMIWMGWRTFARKGVDSFSMGGFLEVGEHRCSVEKFVKRND